MGNPFVHLDLTTSDPAAAKKFYKSVFDWKFLDFPEMGWTGIDVSQGVGGGISGKQDPSQPTAWTAYVGVDDVKKAIARAQKAGATILVPFMEVPNMGYLGVFVDPQGATIGVWQDAAKPQELQRARAKKLAAKASAKKAPAEKAPAAKKPAAKAPARKAPAAKKPAAKKPAKRR